MRFSHANVQPEFLVGWQCIGESLGIPVDTVRRWRDKHGFPCLRLPGGNIAVMRSQVVAWAESRAEMQQALGIDRIRGTIRFRRRVDELQREHQAALQRAEAEAAGDKAEGKPGSRAARQPKPKRVPATLEHVAADVPRETLQPSSPAPSMPDVPRETLAPLPEVRAPGSRYQRIKENQ